jgi:2'-hydroxyisoflavone reductase
MKLLILGGTVFLGRHLAGSALERGHEVTLFNRGVTSPELFPEVEKIRGDRDGDLTALSGREWDAVIDTCGYLPRQVLAVADRLAENVSRYVFTSTIAVYADFSTSGIDETAPVTTVADDKLAQFTAENYGGLKAICERALEERMPGRVISIRAGLIVGPYDPLDRFTYWVRRVARGGEVLAPGRPERQVQIIDARDLADWTIRMIETGQSGVYNATGPDYLLTMGRLLEACRDASGSGARFTWIDDEFLVEQQAGAWQEVPLWLPAENVSMRGILSVDCGRAVESGLKFRPLPATIKDTLEWDRAQGGPPEPYRLFGIELPRAGLSEERELAILNAWRERSLNV